MRHLMAALALSAGPFAFAADPAALTPAAAAALVTMSPDFAGKPAREFVKVIKVVLVGDETPPGWLVEVQWKEGGRVRTGVTAVVSASVVPEGQKPFFTSEGLAIGFPLVEGKTADELLAALKTARVSAFEAGALGDTRTVISGEAAFASVNNGFYDRPSCLAAPKDCVPGYAGPTFLDPALGSLADRHGYRRKFYLGPKANRKGVEAKTSPGSATAFAYTAVPEKPGVTGVRGFCGDDSGRICFTADGSEPDAKGGFCPAACPVLR